MTRRKIYPYQPYLKPLARELRKNSTRSEILLWQEIKGKRIKGYAFLRQKPLLNFIVDFFCYELNLIIEIDGFSHYNEESHQEDLIRQKHLESLGLIVIRFDDDEVLQDMENVLRKLEGYIEDFESKNLDQ